jgi:5-methylcytosine-specific restriction endonuclease McrA
VRAWQKANPGRVREARQAREEADPVKTSERRRRKYERVKADPVRLERLREQQRARRLAKPRLREPRRAEGTLLECRACKRMLPRGVFENAGGGRPRGRCPECDRGRVVMKREARGEASGRLPVDLVARLKGRQTDALGQLKCALCGRVIGPGSVFHVDHIIPVARGGKHEEGNLQIAHRQCNLKKGASLPAADVQVPRGVL